MKRVSRAGRWFRNLIEKFLCRYYEGPDPPRRIAEELQVWLRINPDAERVVIEGYCALLLESAYREGFTRGYEWQERDWPGPAVAPEVLAEMQAQDYSLADYNPRIRRILHDGYDAEDPLANVASPDRRAFFDMLAQAQDIHVIPELVEFEGDPEE